MGIPAIVLNFRRRLNPRKGIYRINDKFIWKARRFPYIDSNERSEFESQCKKTLSEYNYPFTFGWAKTCNTHLYNRNIQYLLRLYSFILFIRDFPDIIPCFWMGISAIVPNFRRRLNPRKGIYRINDDSLQPSVPLRGTKKVDDSLLLAGDLRSPKRVDKFIWKARRFPYIDSNDESIS